MDHKKFNKYILIFKDATASGLQNMGTVLGYKTKNSLILCNLSGNTWTDTYTFILDQFLNDFGKSHKIEDFKHLIDRRYLKKSIMTKFYNVSARSSAIYYKNALRKAGYPEDNSGDDEKASIIHKHFYEFLKTLLKRVIFKNDESELPKLFNERGYKLNLNYYNTQIRYERFTYGGVTDKYSVYRCTDDIDNKKTSTALNANITHHLDAELAAYVINNVPQCYTIHDQFITPLIGLHEVMDLINKFYEKRVELKEYSTSIVL